MALKDDSTLITKGDLKKFYNKILPYMGGNYVFNTLGTKDYYSTDEKIVGVWTDGKPLYQKTILYTGTINANSEVTIPSTISNIDNVVLIKGTSYRTLGNYTYYCNLSEAQSTGQLVNVFYEKSQNIFHINCTLTYPNTTFQITIQYTKTTDAANSAVDTIGCYDITRPDLWPENKEITFGNGLYGQRFTGTYSLSAKQWKSINLSTLVPSSIIDYGGTIQQSTWFNTLPLCYIDNDGALQSEATIWYDPSNNTGLTVSIYISTAQSNSKYDIWVTYKKK